MTPQSDSHQPAELFTTVKREATLTSRVIQQIENLIVEGRLQPGDLLPPERELAQQFGVSRTVIREAVRGLASRHLLEVRPGSGTVITRPTVKSVARSMSLLLGVGGHEFDVEKVLDVRRLLEIEIAGLAAERRTPLDLRKMDEILQHSLQVQDNRDEYAKSDVDFHLALADATHNELFSVLLNSISDVMMKVRFMGLKVPGTPQRGINYHRAIFEQVKAGDPQGARQAMREHLVEAEDTMRKAQALMAEAPQAESAQPAEPSREG